MALKSHITWIWHISKMTLSDSGCSIKNKSVHVWYKHRQENLYQTMLKKGEYSDDSNLHGWGTWQKGLHVWPGVACDESWVMTIEGNWWQFWCIGPKFSTDGTIVMKIMSELLLISVKFAFKSCEPEVSFNSSHVSQASSLMPGKYVSLLPSGCSRYHCRLLSVWK